MITQEQYSEYIGGTAPSNFERLEYIASNELKALMVCDIPTKEDLVYNDFLKALMEQINYLDLNPTLMEGCSNGSYSLGSYSENNSSENKSNETISRISPVAYDILLNCGLLYCGIGRC